MRKHLNFFARGGIFIVILIALLFMLTRILVPKYFFDNIWPTTSTYLGFYEMEKNSVDALFFGSSHGVSSISPQEIYDNYGLRTYNLSCEQQNILLSYYWLKEALRYQQPKAVVLDTYFCFPYGEAVAAGEALNSAESTTRKAMDYMKWSDVKCAAVADICKSDKKQTMFSYYFPLSRFHSRWLWLGENDFSYMEMSNHSGLKGYSMLAGRCGNEVYKPFNIGDDGEITEMVPLMQEYLDKIVDLCNEKGIKLILIKTPSTAGTVQRYNRVAAYAKEKGIEYYDFNENSLYNEIGYNFSADNSDGGHLNYWGAQKVSLKLAEILIADGDLSETKDSQWENSRESYNKVVQNITLPYITDIAGYLDAVNKEYYTVFMAVKDEASKNLNEELVLKMKELGLSVNLSEQYRKSYYAVISPEEVIEKVSDELISTEGLFRNDRSSYSIKSAGFECGNTCSIIINDTEYAKNLRGLNIVVYDNVYNKVVDSVRFDIWEEGIPASR